MKKTLTNNGVIVTNIIKQYDLDIIKIDLISDATNYVFKLTSRDNLSYGLRIALPGWRTKCDLESEAIFLKHLNDHSNITAPKPIFTINNDYLSTYEQDGKNYYALLMTWLEGSNLSEKISEESIYKMGELFANLHDLSSSYSPPQNFTKRLMDKVFARGEKVNLFTNEHRAHYKSEQLDIYLEIDKRVKEAYSRLYSNKEELIVINHDLHHENIIVDDEGFLKPFDFEDITYGYPIQDIAMAMMDLMQEVKESEFPKYLNAFKSGYTSIRQWPANYYNELDIFMAGRMLWVGNWILTNEEDKFKEYLDWTYWEMKAFLESGELRFTE